jgi:hypothetical protein
VNQGDDDEKTAGSASGRLFFLLACFLFMSAVSSDTCFFSATATTFRRIQCDRFCLPDAAQ